MKFFTRGWATGELTDEQFAAAPAEYRRHIAALQLPPTIAALSAVNLHDARVLAVDFRPERSLVTLRLRCGDLQRGYSDVTLTYSHITVDFASLNTLSRAAQSARVEVLYDELDRLGDCFEHRLLLFPDGEVNIQFRRVDVTG